MKNKIILIVIMFLFLLVGCSTEEKSENYTYYERETYQFSDENLFGVHIKIEYQVGPLGRTLYFVEDERELALLVYYLSLEGIYDVEYIMRGEDDFTYLHLYLYIYALLNEQYELNVYQNEDGFESVYITPRTDYDMGELSDYIDEVLLDIPEEATDREKVKFVHDYIVKYSQYDMYAYERLWDNDLYYRSSHPYAVIIEKSGMCAGYAGAMNMFLDRLGIPSIRISSEASNHAWNLVYLDGQWYQLDATWDDPIPDIYEYVRYTYYLIPVEEGYPDHRYDKLTDKTFDLETYIDYGNWLLDLND
jgi:Uncharacterized protein involved in cytokinesis, contains TGc (transglutaminase/protease-like) domain